MILLLLYYIIIIVGMYEELHWSCALLAGTLLRNYIQTLRFSYTSTFKLLDSTLKNDFRKAVCKLHFKMVLAHRNRRISVGDDTRTGKREVKQTTKIFGWFATWKKRGKEWGAGQKTFQCTWFDWHKIIRYNSTKIPWW